MIYDDAIQDLRDVGIAAKKMLKEKGARHIVYAFVEKSDPSTICLLDQNMLEFKTDEQFDSYLKQAQSDIETLYAVHTLTPT